MQDTYSEQEMTDTSETGSFIEIPWDALEEDVLHSLVEEFVTREGTDYGDVEMSLEQKTSQVIHGLKNKNYVIIFDQEMQSCQISDKKMWDEMGR